MSTPTTDTTPAYFAFRPASYWEDNDPLSAILRNVKGSNRRQMITDYWNAGKIEELEAPLLADSTDPGLRSFLESLHPSFMGGEYLPDLRPTEVEVAMLQSLIAGAWHLFSLHTCLPTHSALCPLLPRVSEFSAPGIFPGIAHSALASDGSWPRHKEAETGHTQQFSSNSD